MVPGERPPLRQIPGNAGVGYRRFHCRENRRWNPGNAGVGYRRFHCREKSGGESGGHPTGRLNRRWGALRSINRFSCWGLGWPPDDTVPDIRTNSVEIRVGRRARTLGYDLPNAAAATSHPPSGLATRAHTPDSGTSRGRDGRSRLHARRHGIALHPSCAGTRAG